MSMLEYILIGLLGIILAYLFGPELIGRPSMKVLEYPSNESYYVVELHESKTNPFWFRIFLEQKIKKAGVASIKLSKKRTYILILVKVNGTYEYTLLTNNGNSEIPKDWRAYLTAFGYPAKGFPEMQELDSIYNHQPRKRQQSQRRGYPQQP